MLQDARKVPAGATVRCDVCIIGGGAAGISVAVELANTRLRVCLAESGGLDLEETTQSLYQGRVEGLPGEGDRYLTASRLRYLGGSTNHWVGTGRRLTPIDLQARPWVPHSGWPFDRATLDPYYARAATLCEFRARPISALLSLPDGFGLEPLDIFRSPPVRFGKRYREVLASAPNIEGYLYANVVEIVTDRDGATVEHAAVATLGGNRFTIQARSFVLATGAIENARLLLASQQHHRTGLGNRNDLVGRFFMGHAYLKRQLAEVILSQARPTSRGPAIYAVTAELQEKHRLLNTGLRFRPPRPSPPAAWVRALADATRDIDAHARADRAGGRKLRRGLGLDLEVAPDPDNRVQLDVERDALGVPRVKLTWRLTTLDTRSLRTALEMLSRRFGRFHQGRMRIDEPALEILETGAAVFRQGGKWDHGSHHMGTTRMHDDPKRGVVTADCRVHDLANLFVAGSSVFPTSGFANPTFTLVALAIRLADHLKQTL